MAQGWSEGYQTEVEYVSGFHRELAPATLNLAAVINLVEPPPLDAPFAYPDIGCGRGVTTALLAAANPQASFVGIDFNPAHVAYGRRLAAAAGIANVRFLEASFAEALDAELPGFDFIVAHGIVSWISPENFAQVVALIRRRLNPGGLAYVSYNTLPGWAAIAPLQRLFATFGPMVSGHVFDRLDQCIALMERLAGESAAYFTENPAAAAWIRTLAGRDRSYLVHEYFNEHWRPFYAPDVHAAMVEAKLTYVGSAHLIENFRDGAMTPGLQALIDATPAGGARELVTDFATGRRFRRDVFSRGAPRIRPTRQREILMATRLVVGDPQPRRDGAPGEGEGTIDLSDPIYERVIDALAAGPRTLAEVAADPALAGAGAEAVVRAAMVLISISYLLPCLPAAGEAARRESAQRFNDVVLGRAPLADEPRALASPVLGSGVSLALMDILGMAALARGGADPVGEAVHRIATSGERLLRDGAPITDPAALRDEVEKGLAAVIERGLPFLAALGIGRDG